MQVREFLGISVGFVLDGLGSKITSTHGLLYIWWIFRSLYYVFTIKLGRNTYKPDHQRLFSQIASFSQNLWNSGPPLWREVQAAPENLSTSNFDLMVHKLSQVSSILVQV